MVSPVIDTNVVLRHLLQDHPQHAAAADDLLTRIERGEAGGRMSTVMFAEAVWVLQGPRYALPREAIREALSEIAQIENLEVPELALILEALDFYAAYGIDFADGYQAALARSLGAGVYSFDHDFDRIPGITRIEP